MLFDSLAEYDEEIIFVRTEIRNAVKAREFRLNTSQSSHTIAMDLRGIRDYLALLTTEKQAFIERDAGAGVTAITVRRF